MIWNNFPCWNFAPNSTYFEFKLRFLSKFESIRGWIFRNFVFTNANKSVHKLRQGVFQNDLQPLRSDMDDMHRTTP
jgi:hypothetical protein